MQGRGEFARTCLLEKWSKNQIKWNARKVLIERTQVDVPSSIIHDMRYQIKRLIPTSPFHSWPVHMLHREGKCQSPRQAYKMEEPTCTQQAISAFQSPECNSKPAEQAISPVKQLCTIYSGKSVGVIFMTFVWLKQKTLASPCGSCVKGSKLESSQHY